MSSSWYHWKFKYVNKISHFQTENPKSNNVENIQNPKIFPIPFSLVVRNFMANRYLQSYEQLFKKIVRVPSLAGAHLPHAPYVK